MGVGVGLGVGIGMGVGVGEGVGVGVGEDVAVGVGEGEGVGEGVGVGAGVGVGSSSTPILISSSIHSAGISSASVFTSIPLDMSNTLLSPLFPTTSKRIFVKYPEPLTPVIPESSGITLIVSESTKVHMDMGIAVSSMRPLATPVMFTTLELNERSNSPVLKSIMLSTSMVTSKISPSSTYSGAFTITFIVSSVP